MKKIIKSLRSDAQLLRTIYLNKPFPKGNVTVVEFHLKDRTIFGIGATSRSKSPVGVPKPKSEGGQFEAIVEL